MIKCERCREKFDVDKKPGALLFSPPKTIKKTDTVKKHHICRKCYKKIVSQFKKRKK